MLLKYFALAVGSVAAETTTWQLEPFGNQTFWAGNPDTPNGAQLTFDNTAGSWANGTGSCTVSAADAIGHINAGGMYVDEWDGSNSYTFRNFRGEDNEAFSFDMIGEIDGEQWDPFFASVTCEDDGLYPGDLRMGMFPHGLGGTQGNVGSKDAVWGSFVMTWPSEVNVTFSDQNVVVTEGNGSTGIIVDASMAQSEDLWFEYETVSLTGSYQISVVPVV